MEEQIVTFETAKLAYEKGFDEPCSRVFGLNSDVSHNRGWSTKCTNDRIDFDVHQQISAPTQSLLQKWLREVHNIDITLALVANSYGFYIHNNRNYTNKGENYGISGNTYEQALEKGLQEGLKLIKL